MCSRALGSNENLHAAAFSLGVACARMGRHASNAKELYTFGLSIVGDVTKGLEQNSCRGAIFGGSARTIGYYKNTRRILLSKDNSAERSNVKAKDILQTLGGGGQP